MSRWIIKYWSDGDGKGPVEKWLDKQTNEKFDAVFKELVLLELNGNELTLPHSKALGQGLFELRERHYGSRIYYGFCGKLLIILLAAGDKTSQDRDIKVARQRLLKEKKG